MHKLACGTGTVSICTKAGFANVDGKSAYSFLQYPLLTDAFWNLLLWRGLLAWSCGKCHI